MVADHPYRTLIDHPVQQIDAFLLDFDLEDEWIGILGGPYRDDEDIVVTYNVRTMEGLYRGAVSADLDYRFNDEIAADVPAIYREQVNALKTAFPETPVRCYLPPSWLGSR